MKIYIDILLVTNAIMTLIMLEAAGRICHKVISPLRLLTACSVGGLSSLVMAIDSRGYFTAVLDKACQCGILSAYSLWV